MPTIAYPIPGAPARVELCTKDLRGAIAFYGKLFQWTSLEAPLDGAEAFVMLRRHGVDVAAAYALGPMHKAKEMSGYWLISFASVDVDETLSRVRAAKGGVVFGPSDMGAQGRSAICADRHGAMFGVWQAGSHPGSRLAEEPGTLCWSELVSPDMGVSRQFYREVFGWGVKERTMDAGDPSMVYTEWRVGDKAIGGGLPMTAAWKGIPPHWMPCFQVVNCAEACRQVSALGGALQYGPYWIPEVGPCAMLVDPQEVAFRILEVQAPAPGGGRGD